jgi:hypothetical protein
MKRKVFTFDGQRMPAIQFLRAMKKKYQWTGLMPAKLVGYKSPKGDKGCKLNPDAPPEKEYQMMEQALLDLTEEELAILKEEARQPAEA